MVIDLQCRLRALQASLGYPSDKVFVLGVLRDLNHRKGEKPTSNTVAKRAVVSKSQTRRYLSQFVAEGRVTVEETDGELRYHYDTPPREAETAALKRGQDLIIAAGKALSKRNG